MDSPNSPNSLDSQLIYVLFDIKNNFRDIVFEILALGEKTVKYFLLSLAILNKE